MIKVGFELDSVSLELLSNIHTCIHTHIHMHLTSLLIFLIGWDNFLTATTVAIQRQNINGMGGG